MRRLSWAAALATAWSGAVVGHLLAYAAVDPDPDARHRHLLATGHGSFHVLVHSLAFVLPAALLLAGLRAVLRPDSALGTRDRRLFLPGLAAVQVPLFLLLECLERGFSVGAALSDPAVLVGAGVQVLVAAASAVLLVELGRTVARAVTAPWRTRRPHPTPVPTPLRAERGWGARPPFLRGAPRRAPPAAVGA
ncbi:MAG TPA: hypothetical protein VNO34_11240 [Actinomycetota bacterium]|nr:hypothetical protein [Actinomycetota bacterium]